MKNLEEKAGYRLLKVLYYGILGLAVLALLGGIIGCLYYRDGETLAIFISIVVFYGILELVQLGLFYVLFGKLENYKYNLFYKIYNKFGKEKILYFLKFMGFLVVIGGIIAGISIGFNEYKIYKNQIEKQEVFDKYNLQNEEEYNLYIKVSEDKEMKEKFSLVLQRYRCDRKTIPALEIKRTQDNSVFRTTFTNNKGDCYILLENYTNGGNGVVYSYLYNNKNKLIGKTHNKISNNYFIGGDDNVYINRLDNILPKNIDWFSKREVKTGLEKSQYQDTLEKIIELRKKQDYQNLKKQYLELEQKKIQETFIYMHYRGFYASGNYIGGKWIRTIDLKDEYNNYYKPKFSYQTFLSWYKDVSGSSVKNLEKIGDLKYKVKVKFYNRDNTENTYETILELIKIGNEYKIKNYKSKKLN